MAGVTTLQDQLYAGARSAPDGHSAGRRRTLDTEPGTLDTIVDLGGNTGLAAAYFTARYRPRRLVTVEPIAESRTVLRHNAALSGMPWSIEDCAVAGQAGELEFAVTVAAITVEQLLDRHRIDHVDLLEVDVEGSEVDIFAAPQPWMNRVDRIVLEVHDKYIDGDIVRTTMKQAGFRRIAPRLPDPVGFNPVELYVREGLPA